MTINRRDLISGAATIALGASGASESKAVEKERVQGIGGLFFRSHNPKALSAWYQEHLGIDPMPTQLNQPVWRQAAGETVFAPFPHDTDYFPAQQGWMVNFRVRNLDAMASQLRAAGIEVKVDAQKYPNGRFARLYDPEGNPIELWEPLTQAKSP